MLQHAPAACQLPGCDGSRVVATPHVHALPPACCVQSDGALLMGIGGKTKRINDIMWRCRGIEAWMRGMREGERAAAAVGGLRTSPPPPLHAMLPCLQGGRRDHQFVPPPGARSIRARKARSSSVCRRPRCKSASADAPCPRPPALAPLSPDMQPFHGGPCKASRSSSIEFRDVRTESW